MICRNDKIPAGDRSREPQQTGALKVTRLLAGRPTLAAKAKNKMMDNLKRKKLSRRTSFEVVYH